MTLSPAVETAWPARAAALADTLTELGKLTDPAWRAAVTAVPRHHLVPRYWTQDSTGAWTETDTRIDPPHHWLEHIYSNSVLISDLRRDGDIPRVMSSSSQPGLMIRMLEALDIRDGHRVLEIGTGTGYNAALLCHRLGADNVVTVDIEPDLVDLARTRLAELGYHPTLETADGALGLPGHAPFDRIIATCAVPAVPWAWIEQLRVGGRLLTDIKIAHGAGSLVNLHRTGPEEAIGRFDPVYAAFMDLRSTNAPDPAGRAPRGDITSRRTTAVDPRTPWTSLVVWFLAAFEIGPDVSIGYVGTDMTRPPSTVRISTRDGSWAEVTIDPEDGATEKARIVIEGGPRALWQIVEAAHRRWVDADRPGWTRFGLSATPDTQSVWLDDPATGARWDLPTV